MQRCSKLTVRELLQGATIQLAEGLVEAVQMTQQSRLAWRHVTFQHIPPSSLLAPQARPDATFRHHTRSARVMSEEGLEN